MVESPPPTIPSRDNATAKKGGTGSSKKQSKKSKKDEPKVRTLTSFFGAK
jgi:hypothetical protein